MKVSPYLLFFLLAFASCKKSGTNPQPPVNPPDPVKPAKLSFKWAKSFGGPLFEELPKLATDDAGNVYLTGKFRGTVDFDPGTGTQNLTAPTTGEIYFAKYDKDGNFVFVKNISVSGVTYKGIGADAAGNVYFAGTFTGRPDFDTGAGTQTLVSKGEQDIFVVKYDTNGNIVNKFAIGNSKNEDLKALTVDKAGNCYLGGGSAGVIDMDPGTAVKNLSYPICFIAKYDASGNHIFHKNISTFEKNELLIDPGAIVLTTDKDGSVYAAGCFFVDEYYAGIPNHGADKSKYSVALIKFTVTGNYVYAKPYSYGPNYYLSTINTDADNNVCLSGEYDEQVSFVSKFDNNGIRLFKKTYNNAGLMSAAFDHLGNIYASYQADGYPNIDKLQADGQVLSSKVVNVYAKFSQSTTSLYIAGIFYLPSVDLNFDEGVDIHTNNGDYDVFISKYQLD